MNVQSRNNNVQIYNLSSGPTLPEWLGERARRNLSKRDESIRRRIELIQDFQMPSSSHKVVQSRDGRYVIVGGTYPPRIRCFDVQELTMKFERYLNAQVMDMVLLGDDYGKMALLLEDRTVAFHAHYGAHDSVRIPKFGRAMAYETTTCELLMAPSSGSDIYRLNLEEGRFTQSWSISSDSTKEKDNDLSSSCIAVAHSQPLASVGCTDGTVRFWDNRSPDTLLHPFLQLDVKAATMGMGFFSASDYQTEQQKQHFAMHTNPYEITSVTHDLAGLHLAAGTAGGLVALYDVRSSKPLHIQEHKQGMPIHTVKFHEGSGCIWSGDEKIVKIWNYKHQSSSLSSTAKQEGDSLLGNDNAIANSEVGTGNNGGVDTNSTNLGTVVANVEGTGKFQDFIIAGDDKDPHGSNSGLLLCATDNPKLDCFYIPRVGLAPKWCSFLENVTEELEERDLQRTNNNGTSLGEDGGDVLVQDGQETVFENYKFVSRDDLETLGVSDLIGTPFLRGYMHGFFMDINLYNRVRSVANPFEYEDYRKKKLQERIEKKRVSRIAPKQTNKAKAVHVNPELAERLSNKVENKSGKEAKLAGKLLTDDRFGTLFTNPDFEINENDLDFKLRNPSGVAANAKNEKDDMDSDDDDDSNVSADEPTMAGFRRYRSENDNDSSASEQADSSDDDEDSDEDGIRGGRVRGEAYDEMISTEHKPSKSRQSPSSQKSKAKTKMYAATDIGDSNTSMVHAAIGTKRASLEVQEKVRMMSIPLEKRFKMDEQESAVNVVLKGGSKELRYVPKGKRANKESIDQGTSTHRGKRLRRGVRDLGFKTPSTKND